MRPLQEYEKKRNFKKTSEPKAIVKKSKSKALIFVVQEHHASILHYDFRLEMDGVLKSWSVPKGPSLDPSVKRLAIEVEDHPIPYAKFEGQIPANEYGGGDVYIWDSGTWECEGNPVEAFEKGRISFSLKGKKLKGDWMIFRTKRPAQGSKSQWLLIKRTDEFATPGSGEVDIAMVHDHLNPLDESSTLKKSRALAKANRSKKLEAKKTSASKVESTKQAKAKKVIKKKLGDGDLPDFVEPELALLVDAPPVGSGWIHETKFDGYRTQARLSNGEVQLLTRSGQDWTHKYPTVVRALEKLKARNAIFDGEVVWVDEKGRSDFQKLQNALKEKESTSILYYVFDLLFLDGKDMRGLSLIERKQKLEEILSPLMGTAVLYSDHMDGEAEDFLEASCDYQLEGIVSKLASSPYESGRHDTWVKSKCQQRQEFVIGGFTEGEGARLGFGALLLGVYEDSKLRYVGRVGTGFNSESLLALRSKLSSLEEKSSPFQISSPREKKLHWVQPTLVAEVNFANWTKDGILRVPVFQGLREDKPATEIRREQPTPTSEIEAGPKVSPQKKTKAAAKTIAKTDVKTDAKLPKKTSSSSSTGVKLSHPEKILFAKEKITKKQIGEFYQAVSKWMLPHLSGRPLSIVRCPEGTTGECFFQKHSSTKLHESVETVRIKEKSATREYLTVSSVEGLWALVQQGSIELHGWNSRKESVENPDQFVMDFDPGPNVSWKQVLESVFALKELLDELELKSFVKVTGGKGIHVHVPVLPKYSWDEVKNFSHTLAQEMVSRKPKLLTTTLSKSARNGKIFVDYLRNGKSATAVIPYSLRAREISAVALPVTWEELRKLPAANVFTMEKALEKVANRKEDPWKDFLSSAQSLKLLDGESKQGKTQAKKSKKSKKRKKTS